MARKKSEYVTFTRKGKMLSGRKARAHRAVFGPFIALGSRVEARRNARSAKRVGKRLAGKRR